MDPLTEIGIKHGTDKATFHNFTVFYDKNFKNIRDRPLNILELGIYNGKSLLMLEEYFPNANIYAIDINEDSVKNYGTRIHTYLCSQDDESKLQELFSDIEFDIIIDDGSHLTIHQLKSFAFLFKYVKPGGLYVCEDLHTSLINSYVNSETLPLHLFENYNGNNLHIPEINYTEDNIRDVEVYKRDINAYMCYRCSTINNGEFKTCKNCNVDLSPDTHSYTSIIFKK